VDGSDVVGAKARTAAQAERARVAVTPERARDRHPLIAPETRLGDRGTKMCPREDCPRYGRLVDDVHPIHDELPQKMKPVVHHRIYRQLLTSD
jgi:hypothetical protein